MVSEKTGRRVRVRPGERGVGGPSLRGWVEGSV